MLVFCSTYRIYVKCIPESTNTILPVTPRLSSLARNTAVSPTSAGSVEWPRGERSFTASNMVENGSFETADLGGWDLVSGSAPVRDDYGATDGTFAVILGFNNNPAPNFELSQSIAVSAGTTYSVDFDWAASPNSFSRLRISSLFANGIWDFTPRIPGRSGRI